MTDTSTQATPETRRARRPVATHTAPVAAKDRFESLDVLRGVAILGILMLNVQVFLMAPNSYVWPPAHMDATGVNATAWFIQHVFFEQKFITIFSALFGAGMLLMVGEEENASRKLHFSRMRWLLVFGLIHGFVFWFGDILTAYAVFGFIIVFFRRMSPGKLIFWGLFWITLSGLFWIGVFATFNLVPPDMLMDPADVNIGYTPERLSEIVANYQAGFLQSRGENALNAAMGLGNLVFFGGRIIGVMFLGMALFKLGFLTAKWSVSAYLISVVVGLGIGLPLAWYGGMNALESEFALRELWVHIGTNYIASLFVAFGYASLVMLICKAPWTKLLRYPFAAAGRMAFTNYLGQTFIMVFLAVGGIGMGLFGQLERVEQIQLVMAVWVFQLIFSMLWLQVFRFGPLEWLWRSLSYGKFQPIMKAKA
jgi:uncharacterized protein